ncbi:MAG: HAD superfamily hydrolase (TIGR01509 family) [Planctomycetota bacterium]|jgi:HAD superfamily hydrolase (TIGR01509 family)
MEATLKRTLLLDVMSTLVYDPFYVEMPKFFGMSLTELMREKHPTAWVEFETGRWTEQEFLDNFFADGRRYDQAGFKEVTLSSYEWIPGIEELLRELQESEVVMHVVSNYPKWYADIEAKLKLSRYLPWTYVSCDWGHRKPDPQVFSGLLGQLGLSPEATFFVDDNGANCDAAVNYGIDSHRFQDAEHLRKALIAGKFLRP